MKITTVRCEGYKPFREATELSLAPLTLVFGHNTAGKSALVRLPRLVVRALAGSLEFSIGETRYGESLLDLVHGRDTLGVVRLGVSLEAEGAQFHADAAWRNLFSAKRGNVASVVQIAAKAEDSLDLRWGGPPNEPGSFEGHGPIRLAGMLPRGRVPNTDFDPVAWRERAADAQESLHYLGPHRRQIAPSYARQEGANLGDDGAGAPDWLRDDSELSGNVGAWYERELGGAIEVDPQGESFRLVARKGRQVLNAAQLGEGAQQALPVVTLLHALRASKVSTSLTVIEQPELHLHDAAQGAMADLLLEAAIASGGPLLVETHSEITLLRVRRRIAEQQGAWADVGPDCVAIYWVQREGTESSAKRVVIQPDGWVEDWPRTVYDVTFQEVAALQRAARSRQT